MNLNQFSEKPEVMKPMIKAQLDMNRKFIIYSLPRCGSTTLARILNLSPTIQCLIEPFNAKNPNAPNALAIQELMLSGDVLGLRKAIDNIWTNCTGIKHVWQPASVQLQMCPNLTEQILLTSRPRVIFLTRRNRLQRIVSFELSLQTNIWGRFSTSDKELVLRYPYKAININSIISHLAAERDSIAKMKFFMKTHDVAFFDLCYEDLYDEHISTQNRLGTLKKIIDFIGQSSVNEIQHAATFSHLLNSTESKLNSIATYRLVPGIEEIDRQCRSDEDGWLFPIPNEEDGNISS